MVIQRIQTLFLLIALLLTSAFCCMPFATQAIQDGTVTQIFVKDAPVLLIVNIVIAVLLLLSIFTFKNLKLQKKMTLLSMILICASIVTSALVAYAGTPGGALVWTGGVVLLLVALVFSLMAYKRINHDKRLLSSYDRLR